MVRKRYGTEEIIPKLRAIEVHMGKGLKADEASRKVGITEQTHYRRRKEYGGLKIDQAKRRKKLLAESHRDRAMLQEVVSGNF